jgi:SAM-dependent methyltransferase
VFTRLWICPLVAAALLGSCPVAAQDHRYPDGQAVSDRTPVEPMARIPAIVFIPTPQDIVEKMLELAAVQNNDVVYDLGCGDGRIVVAAAKRCGCRAVGCDIDPLRVRDARENVARNGLGHLVTIEQKDLFQVDLTPATVVTLYLSTAYNARLLPQLDKLKPGSRIVCHQFGIPGRKPRQVVEVKSAQDRRVHILYLY